MDGYIQTLITGIAASLIATAIFILLDKRKYAISVASILFLFISVLIAAIIQQPDTPEDIDYSGMLHLEFIYPNDNDVIVMPEAGTGTIECKGRLLGVDAKDLRIRIRVRTDIWYDQGYALIDKKGYWNKYPIYIGGNDHIIEAQVVDMNGNILLTERINVTKGIK